jgi:hypothetical protein
MSTSDFKNVEEILRELAFMDDTDNHRQHLQFFLDGTSLERRIQYLAYLEVEHTIRLEMLHMDRYENEAVFGPVPDPGKHDASDAYNLYWHYDLPASTIDNTIASVRHLMQTYVPGRLKLEREKLKSLRNPYQFEDGAEESSVLRQVNELLGNTVSASPPSSAVVNVDQMPQADVLKLLDYTAKYLNKLVADGWLKKPIQRLPNGQWYFETQDVLEFKQGLKHAEWLRAQESKRYDDKPSGVQQELAPRKATKRSARRKPPTKSEDEQTD